MVIRWPALTELTEAVFSPSLVSMAQCDSASLLREQPSPPGVSGTVGRLTLSGPQGAGHRRRTSAETFKATDPRAATALNFPVLNH